MTTTPPALPDEAGLAAPMLVEAQARDQGLWFDADTLPEAYLQGALRKLHAAVEHDASLIERLAPRWIPVGANDPTRQVAWIDNQARYVGIILDDRQKFILKLPPQKGST